jgi:hypothetical protein
LPAELNNEISTAIDHACDENIKLSKQIKSDFLRATQGNIDLQNNDDAFQCIERLIDLVDMGDDND